MIRNEKSTFLQFNHLVCLAVSEHTRPSVRGWTRNDGTEFYTTLQSIFEEIRNRNLDKTDSEKL